MRLILASNSPRRRELLQQIGLDFQVLPSDCEEISSFKAPEALVEELARQKAENVAEKMQRVENLWEIVGRRDKPAEHTWWKKGEEIVVLGADTLVSLEGRILGKPEDEKDAFQMIQGLQGKVHQVYSGVALVVVSEQTKEVISEKTFHVKTEVEVVPMGEEEIRSYIATGEPMDKAGAYGIQGRFAAYIKGIVGDYYNVVGLPISRLAGELKNLGDFR